MFLVRRARDNPSEESGTFDSSGAFHGEDRSSKSSRETDNRKGGENSGDSNSGNSLLKSRGESEHLGSHSDRGMMKYFDSIIKVCGTSFINNSLRF